MFGSAPGNVFFDQVYRLDVFPVFDQVPWTSLIIPLLNGNQQSAVTTLTHKADQTVQVSFKQ